MYFCLGSKELSRNDNVDCASLKLAGHFKNGIYVLKRPDDIVPRMAFCNMEVSTNHTYTDH